jgi:hypothetical protein
MCKQQTALDVIEALPEAGGLTQCQIRLAKAQCEDFINMEKRVINVESKVDDLARAVENVDIKLDKVLERFAYKTSVKGTLASLFSNRIFLGFIIIILAIVTGMTTGDLLKVFGL